MLAGMDRAPLIERKQQQARQRIVQAAAELFAARGFEGVSVTDIAQLAEVGRTTFFRHFGDKQEVVFAREQEVLDNLTAEAVDLSQATGRTTADALRALQPLLLRLCALVTADPDEYRRHMDLVDGNVELRARDAAKMQLSARRLRALLVEHGWADDVATLAGQIAVACYWTGRETCEKPEDLEEQTRAAFARASAPAE
jgi:AcrR family transcriptional regulator